MSDLRLREKLTEAYGRALNDPGEEFAYAVADACLPAVAEWLRSEDALVAVSRDTGGVFKPVPESWARLALSRLADSLEAE